MGAPGGGDSEGNADAAHHPEHASEGLEGEALTGHGADEGRIGLARQSGEQEGGAHETIGRSDGAGKEAAAAHGLPVGVEGELLIKAGGVGHHRVLAPVVDHQAAADVLKNCRITRRVGDGKVQLGAFAIGEGGSDHAEGLLAQVGHRLRNRGELIEHVLGPEGNREHGLAIELAVIGFRQVKEVGHQALLVHALGAANVVAAHHHAAETGAPAGGAGATASIARDAAGEGLEVGAHVLRPIHAPPGDHSAIRGGVKHAIAGCRGARAGGEAGEGETEGQQQCPAALPGADGGGRKGKALHASEAGSFHIRPARPPQRPQGGVTTGHSAL